MDARDTYLSTTQGGYPQPAPPPVSTGTPNFSQPGQGGNNLPPVVTQHLPEANVSTGTGADDLKVQAQQARATEEKQNYIDKLKAYAASMSSSPGLYGSIYGPGAEEMFNPYDDPTMDRDLYNLEDTSGFSGDIPITDYQKLKFLSDYGLGSGLGSLMATDSSGNAILDSSGNIIKTGLGQNLSDNWADTFDPGGLRYGNDPLMTGGSAIREHLENLSKNYFDQNFYGMDNFDYGFYGGGPTEVSETFSGAPWFQKGLDEILAEGPTGFGNMESIYGEEFNPEREASFLYLTGVPQFGDETIYDYI
jgi:hypothetical protein